MRGKTRGRAGGAREGRGERAGSAGWGRLETLRGSKEGSRVGSANPAGRRAGESGSHLPPQLLHVLAFPTDQGWFEADDSNTLRLRFKSVYDFGQYPKAVVFDKADLFKHLDDKTRERSEIKLLQRTNEDSATISDKLSREVSGEWG